MAVLVMVIMGLWVEGVWAADLTDTRPQQAAERNWQIGFTPSYSYGKFGTDTTSEFIYAPFSIRRFFSKGDITLVIPSVTVITDRRTTIVGNTAFQTETETAGEKVTATGLGDVILRGRYYLVEEQDYVPLIAVTARFKFPTANASQGLGTGEFDHRYGVEVSKFIGASWLIFLDGGYTFIGDPDRADGSGTLGLRNQYWYDVGIGYYVTKDLLPSVFFEEYQSLVPGLPNARDVLFSSSYRMSPAWRFNVGVTIGLSDGAPDHAVSIGTSYRF